MAGGLRGNNKDRNNDFDSMDRASHSLGNLLKEYRRAGDPMNSPFADAIENMKIDTMTKVKDATDSFNLQRDNAHDAFNLAKQHGQKDYRDQVQISKENTRRMLEESAGQIENARAASTDAAFAAMVQEGVGGMASAGGRQRRIMSEKAKQQIGTMTLGAKHAKESEEAQLRAQEKGLNRSIEEQALGVDQKVETAQLQMDQTSKTATRERDKFVKEQKEAQFNALDDIRMRAEGVVTSTIAGFASRHSKWGDAASKDWDPWSDPFDDADVELGHDLTGDFLTGIREGGTSSTHREGGDSEIGDNFNIFNVNTWG